jgi:hypothetical protein
MTPITHVPARRSHRAAFVCALLLTAPQAGAVVTWTDLGTVSNNSNPSDWQQ